MFGHRHIQQRNHPARRRHRRRKPDARRQDRKRSDLDRLQHLVESARRIRRRRRVARNLAGGGIRRHRDHRCDRTQLRPFHAQTGAAGHRQRRRQRFVPQGIHRHPADQRTLHRNRRSPERRPCRRSHTQRNAPDALYQRRVGGLDLGRQLVFGRKLRQRKRQKDRTAGMRQQFDQAGAQRRSYVPVEKHAGRRMFVPGEPERHIRSARTDAGQRRERRHPARMGRRHGRGEIHGRTHRQRRRADRRDRQRRRNRLRPLGAGGLRQTRIRRTVQRLDPGLVGRSRSLLEQRGAERQQPLRIGSRHAGRPLHHRP